MAARRPKTTASSSPGKPTRGLDDTLSMEEARSAQRIEAIAMMWERDVDKVRKVEQVARHQLEKHRQELHLLRSSALDRDGRVRTARHVLSTSSLLRGSASDPVLAGLGTSLETQREALRETALDSWRREKMMRLRREVYRDSELAQRRADEVDALQAEERRRVEMKQQQEADRIREMRRKWEQQQAADAAGASSRAVSAREKQEQKDKFRLAKEAREQKVAAMIEARQKKREADEDRAKRAANAKAAEAEAEAAGKAKAKQMEQAHVKREALEQMISRLEKVWKLADANAARLEEQLRTVELAHEQQASAFTGDNLRRQAARTDTARKRAATHKEAYDQCVEQMRSLPVSLPPVTAKKA